MEQIPVEQVCCANCGFRVSLSEDYCWVCCRSNPPLEVRDAEDAKPAPRELLD